MKGELNMVEIALGTALAAIGAGVAIGFAGLGSGLGQVWQLLDL